MRKTSDSGHSDARWTGGPGHHLQRSEDHQPHRRRLPEDQLHHLPRRLALGTADPRRMLLPEEHIPLPGHVPLQLQRSGRLHHGRQQLHAGPLPLRLSLSADAHRGLRGALQDVVQAGSPAEADVEKRCKSTRA